MPDQGPPVIGHDGKLHKKPRMLSQIDTASRYSIYSEFFVTEDAATARCAGAAATTRCPASTSARRSTSASHVSHLRNPALIVGQNPVNSASRHRVHGNQEGRHFHGHYGEYIYMQLYVFADGFLLSATLNTAERATGSLALEDLERVIAELRARWPDVEITIRGDSGFCRNEIMKMCEDNEGLHYVLGLAQNSRLREEVADPMTKARRMLEETGESAASRSVPPRYCWPVAFATAC